MRRKKLVLKGLVVFACLFLLSASSVWAACCKGDCAGYDLGPPDGVVNAWDYGQLKQDWGRSDCVPCRALVPKTGQTDDYGVTGSDGDLEKGVAWPNPRFTDNLDGTVTDNLTGLIWLKDANCFGTRTWNNALSDSNGLASGSCGLTDGSGAGDWRLPNRFELESLVNLKYYDPPIPNTAGTGQWSQGEPFNNVLCYNYWTATTFAYAPNGAWSVDMRFGENSLDDKNDHRYVWPVRGGND